MWGVKGAAPTRQRVVLSDERAAYPRAASPRREHASSLVLLPRPLQPLQPLHQRCRTAPALTSHISPLPPPSASPEDKGPAVDPRMLLYISRCEDFTNDSVILYKNTCRHVNALALRHGRLFSKIAALLHYACLEDKFVSCTCYCISCICCCICCQVYCVCYCICCCCI